VDSAVNLKRAAPSRKYRKALCQRYSRAFALDISLPSSGTEIALTVAKTNSEERNSFHCVREEKVKTNYQKHRTRLLSGGCFLAVLVSAFPVIFADDQPAHRPAVEPKDKIVNNEQWKEPERTRNAVYLVGPSGEEIHDFLYPAPENPEFVTSAN
jgi:hypothetical protein